MNDALTEILRFRASADERRQLEQLAKLNDRSMSSEARRAVKLYLREFGPLVIPQPTGRATARRFFDGLMVFSLAGRRPRSRIALRLRLVAIR